MMLGIGFLMMLLVFGLSVFLILVLIGGAGIFLQKRNQPERTVRNSQLVYPAVTQLAQPASAPARYCSHCGAGLQADWTHCPQCGAPIGE